MDNVHETLNDIHEMEEALREGFRTLPSGSDSLNEEELESELNDLLAENGEVGTSATSSSSDVTNIEIEPTKVRIGKRVLDLADLPDVPRDAPVSTPNKSNDDSLEARWKRLRAD